ncbi:MAG TPA: hypothetical protein VH395_11235 [Jatrophihabitantaceae bacterium]|jgi:hypothetical protein
MTFGDYVLDSVLVLIVLRQLRESRLDLKALLLPLGIAAVVGHSYLHSIPTAGNDLILIAGLAAVGVTFGAISGLTTRVRTDGGTHALVKAGWIAAGVWVLSMGSRMAFAIWASNGGGPALGRFSAAHHITSATAWTAALVLMALAEVLVRTGLLWVRAQRVLHTPDKQLLSV